MTSTSRSRVIWSVISEVMQLATSGVLFFLLARVLEPADYGVIGAVIGIARPVGSLALLGSNVLLIQRVAQGVDRDRAWGDATAISIAGPFMAALLAVLAQPILLPSVDRVMFTLLLVGQMNLYLLTETAAFLGVGMKRLDVTAQVRAAVAASRFIGLGYFAFADDRSLMLWAKVSFLTFLVGAVAGLLIVGIRFQVSPRLRWIRRRDVAEGIPFAFNATSEGLLDASDRPLLVNFGREYEAGLYTVGGRIAQMSNLPLVAIMRAHDADVFRAGSEGIAAAVRASSRVLRPAMAVAIAMAFGMVLGAYTLPIVLGDAWDAVVPVVQLLAFLPVIRAVQYVLGNVLTASDNQVTRMLLTLVAAVVNIGLNLWLLRNGGWRTAVTTTLVGELVLTGLFAAYLRYSIRADRSASTGTR